MKDSLIIVSGGMDSITLLYEHKDEIGMALSFTYGQNHGSKEIPLAKFHCEKLGITHKTVDLSFMKDFGSSLTSGSEAIPEGHYAADNMKSTFVSFRNGIMLSVAAGYADSMGLKKIMLANHYGDHTIYPDCTREFVDSLNKATKAGTYNNVEVVSPYCDITKDQICEIGCKIGVPYSMTWSCYKGGEKHCGKCGTCVERKEAFALSGNEDPTEYEA